jgi:hypothetical protein
LSSRFKGSDSFRYAGMSLVHVTVHVNPVALLLLEGNPQVDFLGKR